ncbi:hypothetical protein ACGF3G_00560 [Streptomyces sp. NPDC048179]|uniref:hypothetical protein n=1 Tax=Streptomyces sp. NPDC048179 TaxID=3365506 RepID=UPI003710A914
MSDTPIPVLVSWGLGADSTAILTQFLDDPAGHGLTPDLSECTVIVALTGEEWPDTMDLAERHILPLLARRRVRLVQVARGGPSDTDGIVVLSDTRTPDRLHRRGPWALTDELGPTGTVPQFAAKRRLCSIKFKGWVMDQWAAAEYGAQAYRHVIGYEANEAGRAERDYTYASPTRRPWYPLIDWDWARPRILDHLLERFGVVWPKSYCTMCPYPVARASLNAHLARCRTFPELAAAVLRLESNAVALNPRSTLYRDGSLMGHIRADGNTAALDAYERDQAATDWAAYEVRRVFFAGRSDHCRTVHGTSCRRPGPWCRDPFRKGPAWRSVRTVHRGDRDAVLAHLEAEAAEMDAPTISVNGITRVPFHERGETYPGAEGYLVAAPAGVVDKARDGFDAMWDKVTSFGALDLIA